MSERLPVETDLVLSAIRRGEESLPQIRNATGIDYARLQVIVHDLQFNWKSIDMTETLAGYPRFHPVSTEVVITPKPWCIKCKHECFRHGYGSDGCERWRCGKCKIVFSGSQEMKDPATKLRTKEKTVAYIPPVEVEPPPPEPVKKSARRAAMSPPRDLQHEQEMLDVERVAASHSTLKEIADNLGMTSSQLETRRRNDKRFGSAFERGREIFYAEEPPPAAVVLDDLEPEPEPEPVVPVEVEPMPGDRVVDLSSDGERITAAPDGYSHLEEELLEGLLKEHEERERLIALLRKRIERRAVKELDE